MLMKEFVLHDMIVKHNKPAIIATGDVLELANLISL